MEHAHSVKALAYFDDLFPLDPRPVATTPLKSAPPTDILSEIVAFDHFGARTACQEHDGVPYFVNEFWTSGQRRAHSLHEISYRACFKPQLPDFFISRLTERGDSVFDPFMGRGTTPVYQTLLAELQGQLAPNGSLTVDDEQLGRIVRMCRYGSGGFQGRLKAAFRNHVRGLMDW